jgi:hypothetical protein
MGPGGHRTRNSILFPQQSESERKASVTGPLFDWFYWLQPISGRCQSVCFNGVGRNELHDPKGSLSGIDTDRIQASRRHKLVD